MYNLVKRYRFSKSKLNLYKFCPQKYKLQVIDKIPSKPSEAMERGKRLHEAFELFYKKISKRKKIQKPKEEIKAVIKKLIEEMKLEKDYESIIQLYNFANFNLRIFKTLEKEKAIQNFIPKQTEWKQYIEEQDFVGIIDAVFKDGNNILVLDYKTGTYNKSKIKEYRFELTLYSILWDYFNEEKATHWGIYFSKSDILWTEKIRQKIKEENLEEAFKIMNAIKKMQFEPNINPPCEWCDVYFYCNHPKKKRLEANAKNV